MVRLLVTRREGVYVDLTCGGGGHLMQLSKALSSEALLVGIDRDQEAIESALQNLRSIPQKLKVLNSRFSEVDEMVGAVGISEFDGFLLDLGISSHQIDIPERGFSFSQDGPLDMRMGNLETGGLDRGENHKWLLRKRVDYPVQKIW